MGFGILSRIPIYQTPTPPRSREQSPVRSQPPPSPRATRKILSQLPQAPNRKHHLSELSEPEAKRPTLAQRAGDFSSKNPAAPASNGPVSHAATAAAAAGVFRFTASTSAKPSPPRGRPAPSFSASVGPSLRPQNTTTSTLPRPAVASGRIPRQTRMAPQNGKAKSSAKRANSATIPNGSNGDGSAQAPIASAWDHDEMYASMERVMNEGIGKFQQTAQNAYGIKELLESCQAKVLQSETTIAELKSANNILRHETEILRHDKETLRHDKDTFRHDNETLRHGNETLRHDLGEASTRNAVLTNEIEHSHQHSSMKEEILQNKIDRLEYDHEALVQEYAVMKDKNGSNETFISEQLAITQALQAKIDFLESGSKSQSEHYAAMAREKEVAIATATEATERLRNEETIRRQLHNTIQELKGNIRVFCRVRPATKPDGSPGKQAQLAFPDVENSTQLELRGVVEKSSRGTDTTKTHSFKFDRVFSPKSTNQEVFEEVSQLIQSSLDGYNVCVFAYGQTGSGKTYTMSAEDGMIPRALRMIYDNTKELEDRGWKYTMTGRFVEIYNESINDLLSKSSDKKKLEVKHDLQNSETSITNATIVSLDSTEEVESILARATARRSVAATQANEQSSRSHSVFMLTVVGENTITGEESKGTLNLVDLAGSERLDQSKAEGERLKETQSINRSLSSLGDVIGALGQGKEGVHIPYRNSKLTNLLQFSLGGNSKTLMLCMVSPLKDHTNESISTLRFAAKVNSTHIGRAKKA